MPGPDISAVIQFLLEAQQALNRKHRHKAKHKVEDALWELGHRAWSPDVNGVSLFKREYK